MKIKKKNSQPIRLASLLVTLVLVFALGFAVREVQIGQDPTESEAFGNNLHIDSGNLRATTPVTIKRNKPFDLSLQFRVPLQGGGIMTQWDSIKWTVDVCGQSQEVTNKSINFTASGVYPMSGACEVNVSVDALPLPPDDTRYAGIMKLTITNETNNLSISGPSTAKFGTRPEFTSSYDGEFEKIQWSWDAKKCSSSTKSVGNVSDTVYTPLINKKPKNGTCPVTLKRQVATGDTSTSVFTVDYSSGTKQITITK